MLTRFLIEEFRGIRHVDYEFTLRTHIRWPNGSGKTHILDAIHLLAGSRSVYGDHRLESETRLEAYFWVPPLETPYSIAMHNGKEHYMIQNTRLSRPKYLAELPFRTILVSPFDMNILYFAPEMRRAYMDDILSRTYESFRDIKRTYESTLRQRNALLRRIREGQAWTWDLDFWDQKVAELAAKYGAYRKQYIQFINTSVVGLPEFFGSYQVHMSYIGDWLYTDDPKETIHTMLHTHRDRDIFSGHTHIGPHRDDFCLIMDSTWTPQNVQFFLSRGEMKMLLLGLKILESDFVQKQTGMSIILLVDDILAELDDMNASRFLDIITPHQVILTSQKVLPNTTKTWDFSCINLTLP